MRNKTHPDPTMLTPPIKRPDPSAPLIDYCPPPRRLRGAHALIRVCAALFAIGLTGIGLHLFSLESPRAGHYGRPAATVAFAGAAFLGCVAAGLIGFRKAP